LGYEAAKIWRCEIREKKANNTDTEIGIRTVGCENKEQWQNIGICTIEYKGKCERMVMKNKKKSEV
jgi:hypothetical protein